MTQSLSEFIPLDEEWLRGVDAEGVCPHCGSGLVVGQCQTLVSSVWCQAIGRHVTRPGKYGESA